MAKYVLKFSKSGYFKYTSHLDLLRFFKRTFKRLGIDLVYSQGFNPHPKLGFAQPLSLGYSSIYELLEFETEVKKSAKDILELLRQNIPEGLNLNDCAEYLANGKSLAAQTVAAEYDIFIPFDEKIKEKIKMKLEGNVETIDNTELIEKFCAAFLKQNEIIVKKRQKKTKEFANMDVKPKIKTAAMSQATCDKGEKSIKIRTVLDAGSDSNASPELIIQGFINFLGLDVDRSLIEVERKDIIFSNGFKM